MKYKVISFTVHELEPKKRAIGCGEWAKPNIDFQQSQHVHFLEKHDELSEAVAFDQKLRHFRDQNGPKRRIRENSF